MSVAPLTSRDAFASPPGVAASLVDLLHARAADAFDRPAVIAWRDEALPPVSWGGLLGAALDYAGALEAAGLARGDRLAHVGPHALEWIVVDLACLLSGVVHVALHDDDSPAQLQEQLAWLTPSGLIAYELREARGSANARGALGRCGPATRLLPPPSRRSTDVECALKRVKPVPAHGAAHGPAGTHLPRLA